MKIYGNATSTCTRKVLALLAEKGAQAELVPIDLERGEQKSPEHRARHPFGVVPVLEHGDFRLCESRAILRYLDRALPGPSFTPDDLRAWATMEQWISVEQSYFTHHATTVIVQTLFAPLRVTKGPALLDEQPVPSTKVRVDHAALETALGLLQRSLDVIDASLAGRSFLLGEQFSLADLCFLPYLEYLAASGTGVIDARPHVKAWSDRLRARPAWQAVLRR